MRLPQAMRRWSKAFSRERQPATGPPDPWAAYSADGSTITLALQQDRRVQLRLASVPEPGTLTAVGILAAFGLVGRAVRRKLLD